MRKYVIAGLIGWAAMPSAYAVEGLPFGSSTVMANYEEFYFGIGAAVKVINLPKFHGPQVDLSSGFTLNTAPQLVTGGGMFTFGKVLPDEWTFAGKRPRLELNLGLLKGSSTDRADYIAGNGTYYTLLGYAGYIGSAARIDTTLRTTLWNFDAHARHRADFDLAPNLTLTSGIGVFGTSRRVKYRTDYTNSEPGVTPFNGNFNSLYENLNTIQAGGELSADVTWRVTPQFRLNGGIGLSLFYQHSKMSGRDCISFFSTTSPCNGSYIPYATSVTRGEYTTTRNGMGFNVAGSLGGTWDWGWGNLNLNGFVTWDSNVHGIRNATGPFVAAAPSTPSVEPASIRSQSRIGYGGVVMLAFPFN